MGVFRRKRGVGGLNVACRQEEGENGGGRLPQLEPGHGSHSRHREVLAATRNRPTSLRLVGALPGPATG